MGKQLTPDDLEVGKIFAVLNDYTVRENYSAMTGLVVTTGNQYSKGIPLKVVAIDLPFLIYEYKTSYDNKTNQAKMDVRNVDLIELNENYIEFAKGK